MAGIEWIGLYLVLGAFVGFMAGLLGLGGGGILVPLLATVFMYQGLGVDNVVHLSLGTSLACMMISSTASIRAHATRGGVLWPVVRGITPGIMLGAFGASQAAAHIAVNYIAVFFALFMALIAVQMWFGWQLKPGVKPLSFRGLITTGVGIGFVSALAAVGGGFLTVAYLGYKKVELKQAIGTSAAVGLPIAITGTLGYMLSGWSATSGVPYTLGYIYLPAFFAIAVASSITAAYGARSSHALPAATLKKVFAIISLLLSLKMLVSFVQFN